MKESCCVFGDNGELAGIVTEPASQGAAHRVALVLVTAGLVPKSGPFRLYAMLARRLSREGFVTLRFDLGGIGDSRQDHGDLPLKKRTELEIRAALAYVLGRGDVDTVVLGGLCSGAEDAFRAAAFDARVEGVVMIDPFAYRTAGFYPRYLLHRALRRVRRALGLYEPIPRPNSLPSGTSQATSLVSYQYMESAESRRILKVLLARHCQLHFVYTGGALEVFNHARQLEAMFAGIEFGGLVTLDHLPDLDHTQLEGAHRHQLVEAITRRLVARVGVPSPVAPRQIRGLAPLRLHSRFRALISR